MTTFIADAVAAGGSTSLTLPATIQEGDLLVGWFVYKNVPSGWTKAAFASDNSNVWVGYKVAVSADAGATLTATQTTLTPDRHYVQVWRNATFHDAAVTDELTRTDSTPVVPPSVTWPTSESGARSLVYFSVNNSSAFGQPTGYTTRESTTNTTDPAAVSVYAFDKSITTSPADDGGSTMVSPNTAGIYAGRAVIYESNFASTAPTISTPADNAVVSLTGGVNFSWTHNDPDGDAQTGYALKRRSASLPSTAGNGITYGSEEWWNGSSWVGTETTNSTASTSVTVSVWPAASDTYQFAIATEDAGTSRLGAYSAYRTLNPYEWWDGSAWVLTETFVTSATENVTISDAFFAEDAGQDYRWTVATKDADGLASPYAAEDQFTVRGHRKWGVVHI